MLTAVDVAKYFIAKDTERKFFDRSSLMRREDRVFYEGNARLNKYLHLAQNIYIAKYGQPLFDTPLYAYDNGAVSKDVQEAYSLLIATTEKEYKVDDSKARFLDKIYDILSEASVDELIELSHEDAEWQKKSVFYDLESQKMNSMSRADEYAKQYADIVEYMDRMDA